MKKLLIILSVVMTSSKVPETTSENEALVFNVYYHIVRSSRGFLGRKPINMDKVHAMLNKPFNDHNIYFNALGFDYIDDIELHWHNLKKRPYNPEQEENFKHNAINIYIVQNITMGDGDTAGGYARFGSQYLFVSSISAEGYAIPHEMGHILGLFHTHHYMHYGIPRREKINGKNCSRAGDLVCDTPADNQNGHEDGYTPDMQNIMSYYRAEVQHFTKGQAERMRKMLRKYRNLKKTLVSTKTDSTYALFDKS